MRKVWAVSDSIVSPLGLDTEENYSRVRAGESGIKDFSFPERPEEKLKLSFISNRFPNNELTAFENICSAALEKILAKGSLPADRTLLLLSTTKGNIELLEKGNVERDRMNLNSTARFLAKRFNFLHSEVVSNACISGVLALVIAKRLIQADRYDHVVVLGADVISRFVVSGFQSLLALSPDMCRPFDAARSGINLGEAAAAMILTAHPELVKGEYKLVLKGEGLSNDANHISGPSRTGNELSMAISKALDSAKLKRSEIDFISAHGTATVFNDEMEAKAFFLAGLEGVPLNSLKSYYGHTLGAAGILESIISIRSLLKNEVIGTLGFQSRGVSMPVKVTAKTQAMPLKRLLKTASGFGGCNAAIVFEKEN